MEDLLFGLAAVWALRKIAQNAAEPPAPEPSLFQPIRPSAPVSPKPVPQVQAPVPEPAAPSGKPSPFDRFDIPPQGLPPAPAYQPPPPPVIAPPPPPPPPPPTREELIERIFQRIANSASPFVNDPISQSRFERPRIPIFTLDAVRIMQSQGQSWGDVAVATARQYPQVVDPRYAEWFMADDLGSTVAVFFNPQAESWAVNYPGIGTLNNPCVSWPQGDYDPPCPYSSMVFSTEQFEYLFALQKVGDKVGRFVTYRRANGYWQPVNITYRYWNTSDAFQNMALLSIALGAIGGGAFGQFAKDAVNLARSTYAAVSAFDDGDILKGLSSLGRVYLQIDKLV